MCIQAGEKAADHRAAARGCGLIRQRGRWASHIQGVTLSAQLDRKENNHRFVTAILTHVRLFPQAHARSSPSFHRACALGQLKPMQCRHRHRHHHACALGQLKPVQGRQHVRLVS